MDKLNKLYNKILNEEILYFRIKRISLNQKQEGFLLLEEAKGNITREFYLFDGISWDKYTAKDIKTKKRIINKLNKLFKKQKYKHNKRTIK